MCNADTGVLGQVWHNKTGPQAFPDFKTEHKCKNFDAIREWGEKHQVTLPNNSDSGICHEDDPRDNL
jgi:hypothetical protein